MLREYVPVVHVKNSHEHQKTSHHGKQDELHGGIYLSFSSPYPDKEIHGNEHGFPKHIKQKEIQGDKNPDKACLEQEHEDQVFLDPFLDVCPGRKNDDRHQECGQKYQVQADAVDADVIVDASPDPCRFFDELGIGRLGVEVEIKIERHDECGDREDQRQITQQVFFISIDEDKKQGSGSRKKRDDA
jgi:hypothetical protein